MPPCLGRSTRSMNAGKPLPAFFCMKPGLSIPAGNR